MLKTRSEARIKKKKIIIFLFFIFIFGSVMFIKICNADLQCILFRRICNLLVFIKKNQNTHSLFKISVLIVFRTAVLELLK